MLQLFWTPIALNFFIEFLMVCLLTGYFAVRFRNALRNQLNVNITGFLLLTFASASCGTFLQFLAQALHPDYVNYAYPFVSVFGSLAMLGFVLFAFYFQRQMPLKRWVEVGIALSCCCIIGIESFVAVQRLVLLKQGIVEYRDYWLSIPATIGFFAIHGILLVRLLNHIAQQQGLRSYQCIGTVLRSLFLFTTPLDTKATALRAFFYMALLPAGTGLVLIARHCNWLDWSSVELMNCWLALFTYVGFTLVYINHTPEYSSFQFKLVGITLATVLSILSGIAWIISPAYINAYADQTSLTTQTTLRFTPEPSGGYSMRKITYAFENELGQNQTSATRLALPFAFPFYGKHYTQVFPTLSGLVGLNSTPRWRDVQHQFGTQPSLFPLAIALKTVADDRDSGLFYHASANVAVITWQHLVSSVSPNANYTFQLRLYPNGNIEMAYATLPSHYQHQLAYPNAVPALMGIVPDRPQRSIVITHFERGYAAATTEHRG